MGYKWQPSQLDETGVLVPAKRELTQVMPATDYDCIIIGAGPGGLQAAIHLARFNRKVILLEQGGGRTRHALHLENYLGLEATSGKELVDTGIRQIKSFGVEFSREQVSSLQTGTDFTVGTERARLRNAGGVSRRSGVDRGAAGRRTGDPLPGGHAQLWLSAQ